MRDNARILIIAGSDSGGGAGIQADIKTVTVLGAFAMTAVTAITVQNTLGVSAAHVVPSELVIAQMKAVIDDLGVDAVKIGMIGSAATAHAVAEALASLSAQQIPIVFDPVMVATSGAALADSATIAVFRRLMSLATITTPNLPELEALGGLAGCVGTILVKGGHAEGPTLIDRLVQIDASGAAQELATWSDARINTTSTHGTGCTLASAIATGLGQGLPLRDAIDRARQFVRAALVAAPGFGAGHGPLGHHRVTREAIASRQRS